jgi:hypothetical protein
MDADTAIAVMLSELLGGAISYPRIWRLCKQALNMVQTGHALLAPAWARVGGAVSLDV